MMKELSKAEEVARCQDTITRLILAFRERQMEALRVANDARDIMLREELKKQCLGMVQIRYWASAAAAAGGLSYGAGGR